MQTITNQGLHHDPYYVEYIDRPDGTRFYTHDDPGVQVLDQGGAQRRSPALKGVRSGARRAQTLRNFPFPAPARPAPSRRTPTRGSSVARRRSPPRCGWATPTATRRWSTFPSSSSVGRQGAGCRLPGAHLGCVHGGGARHRAGGRLGPPPAPPARKAVRFYVPGEECLAKLVSGTLAAPEARRPPPRQRCRAARTTSCRPIRHRRRPRTGARRRSPAVRRFRRTCSTQAPSRCRRSISRHRTCTRVTGHRPTSSSVQKKP